MFVFSLKEIERERVRGFLGRGLGKEGKGERDVG